MGTLVDNFGGKVSGELIRASDWNGMLARVETLLGQLQSTLEARITPLESAVTSLADSVTSLQTRTTSAEQLLNILRQRYRHVTLSTPTTLFAIGQRGVITANVTNLDGTPLDLSNPATRPWVDFVTGWGTLKAAAGFISRGGANDKTVSVQVNAGGQAQVLLRAEHAEAFDEDEELEVEAVLATKVGPAASNIGIGQAFLSADTPASVGNVAAYSAITQAYQRTDTTVVQRYLDTYAVLNPARLTGFYTSRFNQRWRDYRTTVLAFVKPDAEPATPDGAAAAASIQVSFRDWIGPWIVLDFLGNLGTRVNDLKSGFTGRIGSKYDSSLNGILSDIDNATRDRGVLGRKRELAAAERAIAQVNVVNPPSFFADLVDTVSKGIGLQQTLLFPEVTNLTGTVPNQAAKALAGTSGKAITEAARVATELGDLITRELSNTRKSLEESVKTSQAEFAAELLRDDGPILNVQKQLSDFRAEVTGVQTALGQKADADFVSKFFEFTR
jgi:hypothetical protein